MTKTEKNELRRLRAVQICLKRNAAAYSGYLGLEKASERLANLLEDLEAVQLLQIKGSKAVTAEKNQYRTHLEGLMQNAFSHLLQVADEHDLDGLREFATMPTYQLGLLKAEELVAKATALLEYLDLHQVSLEDNGYYLDDRGACSDALDVFKDWMQAPRERIELRKLGTTSVPALLLKGRKLVRGQLKGFVERYLDSHPEFVREFHEARKLKRVSVDHEAAEDGGTAAAA